MVGKVRRPRLHGAAPRPPLRPDPAPPGPGGRTASAAKDWDFSSSDIFSGLTIDPDSLVKKLDLDTRSIVSSKTGAVLTLRELDNLVRVILLSD
ncbi:protein FAM207A-like isoform X3 [Centrocercus urophasianus]|uniref:protein FAM207A-like isoform X3 n=1 Tax=Centrocercus urophasianus TaxID=9002 RepID=UPI001C64B83C|nr:protein FAM207A-like isoform X3 [Centrocercus urophasianus]